MGEQIMYAEIYMEEQILNNSQDTLAIKNKIEVCVMLGMKIYYKRM